MKLSHFMIVVICAVGLGIFLSYRTQEQPETNLTQLPDTQASPETLKPIKIDNLKIVTGQTIYVPVYSYIYFGNTRRGINLTNTLTIHNTDSNKSIIIQSVNYYNSNGKLIQSYLEQPIEVAPLASKDFMVSKTNTEGGASASFIVEWIAQEKVSNPVVEAVMISTESTQGISWVSEGRVMKTYTPK